MTETNIEQHIGAEDAVLLKSAGQEVVETVAGSSNRTGANQSGESRAWTMGGRVD